MSHSRLADSLANGATDGTASNMFIDGDTIYSYGYHFPIAKRIGPEEYVINPNSYSNTTSTHLHKLHCALLNKTRWVAPNADMNNVITYLIRRVNALIHSILVSRSRGPDYVAQYYRIAKQWTNIKKRFKFVSKELDRLLDPIYNDELTLKMIEIEFKGR